ncbi:putative GST-like protein YibF [Aquimixticola soesokkakensis]|uniref:Putative GST-like protein YibF n=1 Tax=Aquimixticola soesokkakensis TaxID=1519096 RepID=A0A1Y5RTY0_9RHOB|nr:glutathione S-transferase family protein [Aquimixticola soesokkakensis]SLN22689.1 putative GST-like protein YibF [Aquimixticola soesokkakensis]
MTWHLYTSPRSPFVRKVMIAAHELGLADQITTQDVVTTPMTPAPELLVDNPLGMIPTLMAGERMIFDSLTILEVLNDAAGGALFPAGTRQDCLTRHAMANGMMDKAVRILDEQFRAQNGDTEAHIAGFVAAIKRGISWMEPRLTEGRFDAGDIAFCALLAYLDMRFPKFLWLADAPVAARWYADISTRPCVADTAFQTPPFV